MLLVVALSVCLETFVTDRKGADYRMCVGTAQCCSIQVFMVVWTMVSAMHDMLVHWTGCVRSPKEHGS